MNGNIAKFYFYEGSGSGRINIPIALARDLGFQNKDNLIISVQIIDGQKGVFIYKKSDKD